MRPNHCFPVIVLSIFFIGEQTTCRQPMSNQQRLITDLFKGYKKDAHPGDGAQVNVTFGARLTRITDVEEKYNALQAQWWVKQSWNNPDIQWNKSKYGGLERIHVGPSEVWVPDILLYNNADSAVDASGGVEKFKTKVEISNDGNHVWLAPVMFRSMCTINIKYFPFDDQICSLRFGSWAYDITKMALFPDYKQTGLYKKMYTENQEWEYVSLSIKKEEEQYGCCLYPYSLLVVSVHLRRRSMYYMVYLVFPCALIACMVFLTFIIPPESGERISLGITVLMAMAIFQELTSQKLPPSADGFFLLGAYYSMSICEIGLAIACTCVVLNLYYRRTKMPQWVRRLLLGRLAKLAWLNVPGQQTRKFNNKIFGMRNLDETLAGANKDVDLDMSESNSRMKDAALSLQAVHYKISDNENPDREKNSVVRVRGKKEASEVIRRSLSSSVLAEEPQLPDQQITNSSRQQEEYFRRLLWQEEWKTAALVLDRIILIVAVLIGAVTMASVFLQAPRVKQYLGFT